MSPVAWALAIYGVNMLAVAIFLALNRREIVGNRMPPGGRVALFIAIVAWPFFVVAVMRGLAARALRWHVFRI